MPIYEYECSACGARVEKLIRSQADVPSKCAKCGKSPLKKVFSAFSVAQGHEGHDHGGEACESCDAGGSCPMAGGGCGIDD